MLRDVSKINVVIINFLTNINKYLIFKGSSDLIVMNRKRNKIVNEYLKSRTLPMYRVIVLTETRTAKKG